MSKHYKTGKKLPDELLKKIVAVKDFMISSEHYGTFVGGVEDLLYHTTGWNTPIRDTVNFVEKKYLVVPRSPQSLWPAGWGHMVDYASSYYTYMWSLVYSYDIFSRFKKEGLQSVKVGRELREMILSKGGSEEEMGQMKNFLGRPPNSKAFLKEVGIVKRK